MNVLHETLLSAAPTDPGELATFGRFVGTWELTWHPCEDGAVRAAEGRGTLDVDWILDGRALQDVWAVPGRGEDGFGSERSFLGTTVRFYDSTLGAWRSTWIEPRKGLVRPFIGRMRGDDFELLSWEGGPPLRWTFSEITEASFTWTGEHSGDEGRTWICEELMRATRLS